MVNDENWVKIGFENIKEELKRLGKWMGKNDEKLDNHVQHIEHRLTEIETNVKNLAKKEDLARLETSLKNLIRIFAIILTGVIATFGMVLVILVT